MNNTRNKIEPVPAPARRIRSGSNTASKVERPRGPAESLDTSVASAGGSPRSRSDLLTATPVRNATPRPSQAITSLYARGSGDEEDSLADAVSPALDMALINALEDDTRVIFKYLETLDTSRLLKDQDIGMEKAMGVLRRALDTTIHHLKALSAEKRTGAMVAELLEETRNEVTREREIYLQKVLASIDVIEAKLENRLKGIKTSTTGYSRENLEAMAANTAAKVMVGFEQQAVEQARTIRVMKEAVAELRVPQEDTAKSPNRSVAQVAGNDWRTVEPRRRRIQMSIGQEVIVAEIVDIIIKPCKGVEPGFRNPGTIEAKLRVTVDPEDLGMMVLRVLPRSGMVVMVLKKGEGVKLMGNRALANAGLIAEPICSIAF